MEVDSSYGQSATCPAVSGLEPSGVGVRSHVGACKACDGAEYESRTGKHQHTAHTTPDVLQHPVASRMAPRATPLASSVNTLIRSIKHHGKEGPWSSAEKYVVGCVGGSVVGQGVAGPYCPFHVLRVQHAPRWHALTEVASPDYSFVCVIEAPHKHSAYNQEVPSSRKRHTDCASV